jgi:pimeloyl-ACP methyl ester carboxylesterase
VLRRPLPRPSPRLLAVAAVCALGAAGDHDLTIFGRFCLPRGKSPQTVLLALHGITYTGEYWDSQLEPETYAFTRTMTDAGYAVLAVDRLGYGRSTHPPSAAVTLDVQAEVADVLVDALRDGAVEGTPFRHVALVGHSYGTATSWRTTALHNNADVVVGTGWGSTIQTAPLGRFFTGFYPETLDDKFRDSGYHLGYFTAAPGGRDQDFLYDRSNADPAVVRDGLQDGLFNSLRCDFDPQLLVGLQTPCGAFDQSDADLLWQVFDGPRRSDGSFLWYGLEPATDLGSAPGLTLAATASS